MSNAEKLAGLGLKGGDYVRIVIEDEVKWTDCYVLETARNMFSGDANQIVSVEKIVRPLPNEPGTVFRARLTMGDESEERTVFVTERDCSPARYVLDRQFCGYGVVYGSDEDFTIEVLD